MNERKDKVKKREDEWPEEEGKEVKEDRYKEEAAEAGG